MKAKLVRESLNENKFKNFFKKGENLDEEVPYRINDEFVEYKTPRGWKRFKWPIINKRGTWGYDPNDAIIYQADRYDKDNYLTLHKLMFGEAGIYEKWLDITKETGVYDLMRNKKHGDYDLGEEAPKLFKERFPTPSSYYEWFDKKMDGLKRMHDRQQEYSKKGR